MKFRKADVRTIWVFAVIAVVVLVIVLTGVWKRLEFFTTLVSFLGFETDVSSGASIVGLNLAKGDLEYFTGEKWTKIKDSDGEFVLDVYKFKLDELKSSLSNFYLNTARKPETFSVDVNHWKYWTANFVDGKAVISSRTKKGFVGPSVEMANLGYTDNLDYAGISYVATGGYLSSQFLELESNPQRLKNIISWRDSILSNGDCEKLIPLNIKFGTSSFSDKQNSDMTETFYKVRKTDEYIFVDLSEQTIAGKEEKYKEGCFKIESYIDINRDNWKNSAIVEIKFVEDNLFPEKDNSAIISWKPFGKFSEFSWIYRSSKTQDKEVLMFDNSAGKYWESGNTRGIPKHYQLDFHTDFHKGFVELSSACERNNRYMCGWNRPPEAYDIHVYIGEDSSLNEIKELDRILGSKTKRTLDNNPSVSNRFIYAVLNEYNKYLKSSEISLNSVSDYIFLFKDGALTLVDKLGVSQNIQVSAGKIIMGTQIIGDINSEGVISINYALNIILIEQFPIADLLNSQNLFDLTYEFDPTSPLGYSKISKESLPSNLLGSWGNS